MSIVQNYSDVCASNNIYNFDIVYSLINYTKLAIRLVIVFLLEMFYIILLWLLVYRFILKDIWKNINQNIKNI